MPRLHKPISYVYVAAISLGVTLSLFHYHAYAQTGLILDSKAAAESQFCAICHLDNRTVFSEPAVLVITGNRIDACILPDDSDSFRPVFSQKNRRAPPHGIS
jgi:hypothetical protein